MAAYTGALARSAYYADPVSRSGVTPAHDENTVSDDVFTPVLDATVNPGTVAYDEQGLDTTSDGPSLPTTHTGVRAIPPSMGLDLWRQRFVNNMVDAHDQVEYISDAKPVFKSASEQIDYVDTPDNGSGASGISGPDWFMTGQNGYDVSNPENDMNSVTGGRYRLGRRQVIMGEYDQHSKIGFDTDLRAVTFRAPYLPQDTPPVVNPVGRTNTSSGTTRMISPLFNIPQLFATPGSDAMTEVAMSGGDDSGDDFGTGTGDFQ